MRLFVDHAILSDHRFHTLRSHDANELQLTIEAPPLHRGEDPRSEWHICHAVQRAGVPTDRTPAAP